MKARKAWDDWKKLSKKIGKFQARVLFSILYFALVTPIGFFRRKSDDLHLNTKPQWLDYTNMPESMDDLKEQF